MSLVLSCLAEHDRNACREGSVTPRARVNMEDDKSKSSSHFPHFEASNAWQMGHNSRQGFILGQELLLDFAAWIELTSNADNWLAADISCVGSYRTRFASLKRAGDLRVIKALWCLSTTRQATRYLKTMLKILVERAVLHHFSLLWRSIEIHVLSHVTITCIKNSLQIPAVYAFF